MSEQNMTSTVPRKWRYLGTCGMANLQLVRSKYKCSTLIISPTGALVCLNDDTYITDEGDDEYVALLRDVDAACVDEDGYRSDLNAGVTNYRNAGRTMRWMVRAMKNALPVGAFVPDCYWFATINKYWHLDAPAPELSLPTYGENPLANPSGTAKWSAIVRGKYNETVAWLNSAKAELSATRRRYVNRELQELGYDTTWPKLFVKGKDIPKPADEKKPAAGFAGVHASYSGDPAPPSMYLPHTLNCIGSSQTSSLSGWLIYVGLDASMGAEACARVIEGIQKPWPEPHIAPFADDWYSHGKAPTWLNSIEYTMLPQLDTRRGARAAAGVDFNTGKLDQLIALVG